MIRQLGGNECASQLCLSKLGDLEQVTLPLLSFSSLANRGYHLPCRVMVNTKYNVCKASAVSISNGFQKTNFPKKPAKKYVIYVATDHGKAGLSDRWESYLD